MREGEIAGSRTGLGCSSNGAVVVCTYASEVDGGNNSHNVVAYDYNGTDLYESQDLIGESVFTGAALFLDDTASPEFVVAEFGTVYKIDVNDPNGTASRDEPHGSGSVISPVITSNDVVILAGTGPVVTGRRSSNLSFVGTLCVDDNGICTDNEYFSTRNTPAVVGDRVYVSMQHFDDVGGEPVPDDRARLVAFDVDPTAVGAKLKYAWGFDFDSVGDGSKSSPLVIDDAGTDIILFDGFTSGPSGDFSTIFAVDEDGDLVWSVTDDPAESDDYELEGPPFASFAADLDGDSFWHLTINSGVIRKRSVVDGIIEAEIDIGPWLNSSVSQTSYRTASAMTIVGDATDPYRLVSAFDMNIGGANWVLAVDIDDETLEWQVEVPDMGRPFMLPAGQYGVVSNGTDTRVVFSGVGVGVYAIGAP